MNEKRVQRIIEDIIEQQMRGCVLCNSQVDLIFCQGIQSYVTGKDYGLLCRACREEYLFTDEGFLDEEKLNECFYQALELEEDND